MNAELRRHMATPIRVTVALLVGLAINLTLATVMTFKGRGYVEAGVAAVMVGTVLIVSMEVRREAPLVRLFACIGFLWLFVMFAFTLLDYFTR